MLAPVWPFVLLCLHFVRPCLMSLVFAFCVGSCVAFVLPRFGFLFRCGGLVITFCCPEFALPFFFCCFESVVFGFLFLLSFRRCCCLRLSFGYLLFSHLSCFCFVSSVLFAVCCRCLACVAVVCLLVLILLDHVVVSNVPVVVLDLLFTFFVFACVLLSFVFLCSLCFWFCGFYRFYRVALVSHCVCPVLPAFSLLLVFDVLFGFSLSLLFVFFGMTDTFT